MKICLFFTYGNSLERWDKQGLFSREIRPYLELAKQGHSVAFFTYGDSSDLKYANSLSGIEIIPAYDDRGRPRNKGVRFIDSFMLPFRFRKQFADFELFKTNQMWGAWVPVIAKALTGRRLLLRAGYEAYQFSIFEKSPGWLRSFLYFLSLMAYKTADHILLSSQTAKNFVVRTFNIPLEKISVLSNYVDTELFKPNAALVNGETRALFVGRLTSQKNLYALISACKKARLDLEIIGEGPLQSKLQAFADEQGANVQFLGNLPNHNLPERLRRSSIFALPSLYEGSPKAMLEAMSSGIPVVGANTEGIRGIIQDGENGLLCEPDSESLTAALIRLKENAGLRQKIGTNARKYVLEHFGLEAILRQEQTFYEKA